MGDIQKIKRIELREAFKQEALDFTKWLQENLDAHHILKPLLETGLVKRECGHKTGKYRISQ